MNSPHATSGRFRVFPDQPCFLLLCLLLFLAGGCASSNPGQHYPAILDVSDSRLPAVRSLPHHPDSLVHVTLTIENGDTIVVADEYWSSRRARERWTAGRAFESGPIASSITYAPDQHGSFATLQSLELSLAAFSHDIEAPAVALANYSPGDVQERLKSYRNEMQVHYCRIGSRFEDRLRNREFETLLMSDTGQQRTAARVELRERGQTTSRDNATSIPYRCYAIYFKRKADGTDILDGASKLTFWPEHGPDRDPYYTWTLPRSEATSARRRD